MAHRLSYQLLPTTHFGGRKVSSTEHAGHHLLERIQETWNTKKIASLLLLDVAGAFDNVVHEQLLHNLRKGKIDEQIIKWIASFLTNRTNILKTGEFTSDLNKIASGIPQGSPLSRILYLFYNADLLENINQHDSSSSLGYIDDIGILVTGNSTEENCNNLATIHEAVCRPWADTYGSSFAVTKYQLIHFTRRTSSNINHPLLLSSSHQVTPTPSVGYLGITLDIKLKWNAQLALIKTKVQKSIGALASLGGSTWGANLQVIHKIYLAVVISRMTYGLSIWYTPYDEPRHNRSQLAILETLQYKV